MIEGVGEWSKGATKFVKSALNSKSGLSRSTLYPAHAERNNGDLEETTKPNNRENVAGIRAQAFVLTGDYFLERVGLLHVPYLYVST